MSPCALLALRVFNEYTDGVGFEMALDFERRIGQMVSRCGGTDERWFRNPPDVASV